MVELGDINKDDVRLLKKLDDFLSLKLVFVGVESLFFFNLEKKIVIFVEFFNESVEVKLLFNIGKDVVVGNDGKKDIFVFFILG